MPLSTPPTAPQRGDRTTFAGRVDAFITWLIGFVSELNIFSANLNSLAAGGAYAIPYVISARDLAQNDGLIGTDDLTSQSSAIRFYINKITAGNDVSAMLAEFDDSSSVVKGYLRIVKQGDPSKWLVFEIGSLQTYPRFFGVSGATTFASSTNPFADGDAVMLSFQRTGDKGDTGPSNSQVMFVRDEKSAGTAPASGSAGVWNARTLNTVKINEISGASLSGSLVTLPAGTYEYDGSAPAYSDGPHKAQLWNSTDGVLVDNGTSESGYTTTGMVTRSLLRGKFTITAPKAFGMNHFISNAGLLGIATGATSGVEVYAEIKFKKVA